MWLNMFMALQIIIGLVRHSVGLIEYEDWTGDGTWLKTRRF